MDRSTLPRDLRPFVNDEGQLTQWPTRQKVQRIAVAYLAARFEFAREYHEREVNQVLIDAHTFGDWALLRRMLCDWRHLERDGGGARYRRLPPPVSASVTSAEMESQEDPT